MPETLEAGFDFPENDESSIVSEISEALLPLIIESQSQNVLPENQPVYDESDAAIRQYVWGADNDC